MTFFISALVTIFITVDTTGVVPVCLALTPTLEREHKLRVMRRAVLVAGAVLGAFAGAGRFVLRALGISVPAFYISGGSYSCSLPSICYLLDHPARSALQRRRWKR